MDVHCNEMTPGLVLGLVDVEYLRAQACLKHNECSARMNCYELL